MIRTICVGGAPSSGTTLLADLLDAVPGICCPPELYVYSDIDAYEWSDAFLQSALSGAARPQVAMYLAKHEFFNRKYLPHCGMVGNEVDALLRSCDGFPAFIDAFASRYAEYRSSEMAVLAEKTPVNVNCASKYCDLFPDGLFVHVVRDGRDVVASLRRRGFSLLHSAMIWMCQVQVGLRASGCDGYMEIRYEDLINRPFDIMVELGRRVSLDVSVAQIEAGFRNNPYRAGLERVKTWSAPNYSGEIKVPPAQDSSLEQEQIALLAHIGAQSDIQGQEVRTTFAKTMETCGYELDCASESDAQVIESMYVAEYAKFVSNRYERKNPWAAILTKPVHPFLVDGEGCRFRRDVVCTPADRTAGQETPVRVLQGVSGQAGQPAAIARSLRAHGIVSAACSIKKSGFGYTTDLQLAVERNSPENMYPLMRRLTQDYDVFHFHGATFGSVGHGFSDMVDLVMLKMLGAKVFWHCRGTDTRLEREFRKFHPYESLYDSDEFRGFRRGDAFRRRKVAFRLAVCDDVFVVDEELQTYVPGATIVKRVLDKDDWPFVGVPETAMPRGMVTVVHAPSRAFYKGTDFVIAAVETLKSEGLAIDLQLVTGLSNEEAKEIYKRADIVIDQLLIGWYGVLAVECMALGKPVIAYIRPDLYAKHGEGLPIVNASIDSITDELRSLVNDRRRREQLAQASREYFEREHASEVVAAQLADLYTRPTRAIEDLDWQVIWSFLGNEADEYSVGRLGAAMDDNRALRLENERLRAEVLTSLYPPRGGIRGRPTIGKRAWARLLRTFK